jgi:hypothetical protein
MKALNALSSLPDPMISKFPAKSHHFVALGRRVWCLNSGHSNRILLKMFLVELQVYYVNLGTSDYQILI